MMITRWNAHLAEYEFLCRLVEVACGGLRTMTAGWNSGREHDLANKWTIPNADLLICD